MVATEVPAKTCADDFTPSSAREAALLPFPPESPKSRSSQLSYQSKDGGFFLACRLCSALS